MHRSKQWIRGIAFLLVSACLFSVISSVLERKTYNGAWNYMAKMNEFYSMETNSLSYVVIGSSHAYCTVNPLAVWEESNIKGFVLATQQQPLRASYHYLVEVFKTQAPQVVFIEGYMGAAATSSDAVLYDAVDPLRFSFNKLQMIRSLVPREKQADFVFNLAKYHTRWSGLSADQMLEALKEPEDRYKGFVPLENSYTGTNFPTEDFLKEPPSMPQESLSALNDILALCRKYSARLVLLIAPYDPSVKINSSAIAAELLWAKENSVDAWDYSRRLEEVGIDPDADYYDKEHLDCSGADKVSKDIAERLLSLGIQPEEHGDEKWDSDYKHYQDTFRKDKKEQ